MNAPSICATHMHPADARRSCDASMHERTYGLTDADASNTEQTSRVRDAHAAEPRIYLVEWPHFDFVKIGVTVGKRWQTFGSRGGVLRELWEPTVDAWREEARLHAHLTRIGWPRAFDCKEAAVPFLGHRGAGWTECYRIGEPGEHRQRLIDELAARRRA